MADHSDIRFQAGQVAGQGQIKKDHMMESASETMQSAKERAGGFIQQTNEQMKSMAQSAADTVKNAVGMGNDASSTAHGSTTTTSTTTTTTKH